MNIALLTITSDKISAIEIVAEPMRLAQLDIRVLEVAARPGVNL